MYISTNTINTYRALILLLSSLFIISLASILRVLLSRHACVLKCANTIFPEVDVCNRVNKSCVTTVVIFIIYSVLRFFYLFILSCNNDLLTYTLVSKHSRLATGSSDIFIGSSNVCEVYWLFWMNGGLEVSNSIDIMLGCVFTVDIIMLLVSASNKKKKTN